MRQTTKRLYSRAAAMLLMMLLTTMTAWAETENLGGYEFTIGTDGEGQYYKVDCKEALDAIATFVNGGGYTGGKRFKQTANITYTHTTDWNDANSTENNYTAIGYYDDDDGYYSFYGTYDGGGYTISGIRIYKSDECQGLFGSAYGTVKNVTLTDARITGGDSTAGIVGDLTDDAVSNCRVASNVAIHNAVPSTSYYGGVVGYNDDGTVSDCFSAATISTKGVQFGAIVGYNNGTLLRNTYIYTTCYGVGTGKKTSGDVTENNGAVNASPDHFTDNGDDTYTIKSALGWDVFCDLLEGGTSFTGKTIYLNGNIEVSRMAGDSGHKFTGTFNGQGNTLTVSYSGSSYVAPFSYVDGATIQNLVVEGTISSTGTRAAGVIGETGSPGEGGTTTSHIINCVSSSTITGGNYSGGFSIGGNVEIEGCVFNGTINISGDYGGGGFVGYSQSALTITNCLFAPQSGSSAKGTFYYNGTAGTITNSYYTTALGTAQGKKACPAIAAPVGDATHATYSVSQITPYANGLTCGETFYYGGGENVSVSYVNESGYTVSHNCTALDPSYMPTTVSGWYYVADDITYTDKITLGADVTFILADDKTMNICTSESPRDGYCIEGSFKDLTIYGQTNQSGTLNAYNDNSRAVAVNVSDYTQHGGNVNIDAKKYTALYPYNGNLTLTRGSLTVNGASHAITLISDYSATVSGGTLTATVSGTSSAISGPLALSGTATVKVTGGIYGTFTIAAGQVFTDGNGHYYTGTLSDDEKKGIDGQTLTRLTALQLADAGDNSAAIDKCNGIAFPVTLQGRTLYKDGDWNTLCLPFDVTIAGSTLDGADVRELDNANLTDGVLTLNFTNEGTVTKIEAGKPYIIKWASGENLVNPEFSDVTVKSGLTDFESTDHVVKFKGTYEWREYTEENTSILFVGADNKLYWPKPSGGDNPSLGACRAYFQLTPGASVREFNLNFGEGSGETGIICPAEIAEIAEMAGAWYSLDGRKLSGQPTTKGLYIHGGRKVVIP